MCGRCGDCKQLFEVKEGWEMPLISSPAPDLDHAPDPGDRGFVKEQEKMVKTSRFTAAVHSG
jgi:hypothetical protein